MKKTKILTRIPMAIIDVLFSVLAATRSVAVASPNGPGDGNWIFGYPLEGAWTVSANLTTCGPTPITLQTFQAMSLFSYGGTMHDVNSAPPAIQSHHVGIWQSLGGGKYSFAFRFFRFENGAPVGYNVVRHEIMLSSDAMSYVSSGTGEVYDMLGNHLFTGCSTSTATRFE
jgi:hypothetical protein